MEKNIFCRDPFFPEGQELLSLTDDKGLSKGEINSRKSYFFVFLKYHIMIAETQRYESLWFAVPFDKTLVGVLQGRSTLAQLWMRSTGQQRCLL
jgi:hypothetical protein